MLEASNVSVRLGSVTILTGVSLRVAPGELVALLGPNGAGKSTFMRTLSGTDLTPDSGQVTMDGRPVGDQSPVSLAQRRALVSQEQHLQAAFPAFDVVLMGRAPHVVGREQPKDFAIADAALSQMKMGGMAERAYTVLSGGEKQRISLARAAAQIWEAPPEGNRYLLLDEPTNNLDLAHQHSALRRARAWARDGVGVVTVLHDLNLAAQYADRLVVLHCGKVVAEGSPRSVLTPHLMRSVFRTEARIENHPCLDCPLVVAFEALDEQEDEDGRYNDNNGEPGRAVARAAAAGEPSHTGCR